MSLALLGETSEGCELEKKKGMRISRESLEDKREKRVGSEGMRRQSSSLPLSSHPHLKILSPITRTPTFMMTVFPAAMAPTIGPI